MSKQEPQKERYANAANKHIDAAIKSLYRFETEQNAIDKLENIKEHFTISGQQEENPPKPCLILWIKDYEVTEAEGKQGYMGNYAFMTYEPVEDGHYTLSTTKLETELKYHPRRKRQNAPMPNWGHPILRSVKKGKIYPSIEAVAAELQQLHLEHPETTIPGENKLYLMIFSREEDPKNPVQKYVLEIKNVQGGGFTLECIKNDYVPKESAPTAEEVGQELPQGHFTSMLALKRNKKKQ